MNNQTEWDGSYFLSAFPANVNVMDVWRLFLIRGNRDRRCNSRLGHLLYLDRPFILWSLQVAQSVLGLPIGNANIYSVLRQDSINFRNHFARISC